MNIGFPKKVPPPIDQSCVLYMKMDEASGNIKDWSGNGNTGTPSGSPTYSVAGKFGTAMQFDGVDDYVDAGNGTSLNIGSGNFTIEAWVKTSDNRGGIVDKTGGNDYFEFIVYSNMLEFTTRDSDVGGPYTVTSSVSVPSNTWAHVVSVRNKGGTNYVYIDGIQRGSGGDSNYDVSNTGNLKIGFVNRQAGGDSYLSGTIDEVRIYNRALTAQEIKRHHMAGR